MYTINKIQTPKADKNVEFIRLPKSGSKCPYTGLSRTSLNWLILPNSDNGFNAPVRSVVFRKQGRSRGIRLIDFDSLCKYLNSTTPGSN